MMAKKENIIQEYDFRRILKTSTCLGSLMFIAILPMMSDGASGQDTQLSEKNNIKAARQVIDAFNTGNVSNISEFISLQYFNRESQVDPIRGQLREPSEFIDTVENLGLLFRIFVIMKRQ